jgi:hypothetical protein
MLVMQGPVHTKHIKAETALQLFGLSCVEVVRCQQYDAKALIAAGGNTIVIAFRGTATTSAALADLQVHILCAWFCDMDHHIIGSLPGCVDESSC